MIDDDFLVLVNSWWEQLTFTVPDGLRSRRWDIVCDSFDPARNLAAVQSLTVGPRSFVVLQSSGHGLAARDRRSGPVTRTKPARKGIV